MENPPDIYKYWNRHFWPFEQNLFNKTGPFGLERRGWRPNPTTYRKFDFNEFVANVFRDNMSMIIFDLRGCGGC